MVVAHAEFDRHVTLGELPEADSAASNLDAALPPTMPVRAIHVIDAGQSDRAPLLPGPRDSTQYSCRTASHKRASSGNRSRTCTRSGAATTLGIEISVSESDMLRTNIIRMQQLSIRQIACQPSTSVRCSLIPDRLPVATAVRARQR